MKSAMDNLKRTVAIGALVVGVSLLSGCLARVETRGNLPDPDLLASLDVGEISRNEVEQVLGSPSSVAMFENETWFYISERTETVAFFEPEVKERQVVIVQFDMQGVLLKVQLRGLEEGQDITPVERETPTLGNEPGILQQFFGNIGRFNKD